MHTDALDKLETACLVAVARDMELAGVSAVYAIDGAAVGLHDRFAGCTGEDYCYTLRDHIREWRGPGPGFVIRTEENNPAELGAIGAHELGHCITYGTLCPSPPVDVAKASATVLQAIGEYIPSRDHHLEWLVHGAAFVRATLHTAYRMVTLAGHDCGINALWPSVQCPVAPWDAFHALEDEMESRLAEPITSILATPAPSAFTNLFAMRKSA